MSDDKRMSIPERMNSDKSFAEGYALGATRILEVFDSALEEIEERLKSGENLTLHDALRIIRRYVGRLKQ